MVSKGIGFCRALHIVKHYIVSLLTNPMIYGCTKIVSTMGMQFFLLFFTMGFFLFGLLTISEEVINKFHLFACI